VVELLVRSGVKTEGAEVVILGRGNIVGKPMAAMLCQKGRAANATVTICHSATRDIAAHCRRADIIVAAMGVAEFLKADMVKPGVVVMDVGSIACRMPAARPERSSSATWISRMCSRWPDGSRQIPAASPDDHCMLLQNTVRAAEQAVG